MINLFWRLLAKLLARPAIANWIITRAQRTPYLHIMSADGGETYMGRWWLFNAYDNETRKRQLWWFPWSIRVHHIMRPDQDRDLHDHPWNARTVILRGWYVEERRHFWTVGGHTDVEWRRDAGQTATLDHGEYHRIDQVSPDGVWTLFITGNYKGSWGFMVDGIKVPYRTYLEESTKKKPAPEAENAAFESWARNRTTPLDLRVDEIGLYFNEVTGVSHDAWQARAALVEGKEHE